MRKHLTVTIFFILLATGTAQAHKVHVYADPEGAKIVGAARFASGTPVTGGKVRVTSPAGKELLTTETAADGTFTFTAPYRSNLHIVVDAGEGHGGECMIWAEDLPDNLASNTELSKSTENKGLPGDTPSPEENRDMKAGTAELNNIIGETISQRLRPLNRRLESLEDTTRLQDIIGSIGYIFGLAGIAFYFMGRRERLQKEQK